MRKWAMQVEIEKLRAEVSYLRGQIAELQKAPGEVVAHVENIVTATLKPLFAQPPAPMPDPYSDTGEVGLDWTDQLAPRVMNASDLEHLESQLNDGLVISDE